jgi:hypothetical protein
MKSTLCRAIVVFFALGFAILSSPSCFGDSLALWTFETTQPSVTGKTAGPYAAESGINASTSDASGSHASSSTVYSSPAGNASAHSFSSSNWATNDDYEFSTSTLGYDDIQISWDQTSSNTGPRDFGLYYSTNGTSFTEFGSNYTVLANASPNTAWSSTGTRNSAYTFTIDLSSITGLNNSSTTIYFELIDADTISANGGTVASGGTDRVDNFLISADKIPAPTPEPMTMVSAACIFLAGGVGFLHRNWKTMRS